MLLDDLKGFKMNQISHVHIASFVVLYIDTPKLEDVIKNPSAYTSTLQRVVFKKVRGCLLAPWDPSIWHPLKGPGMDDLGLFSF